VARAGELDLGMPNAAEQVDVAEIGDRSASVTKKEERTSSLLVLGRLEAFERGEGNVVAHRLRRRAKNAVRALCEVGTMSV
jgi:hypothetical protein